MPFPSVGDMQRSLVAKMRYKQIEDCERAARVFDGEGDPSSAKALRAEASRIRGLLSKTGKIGNVFTTKEDVLQRAKPLDDGTRSLQNDMIKNMSTMTNEELWSDGCRYGWEDAYVKGWNGDTTGVKINPDFAYDAAYGYIFSTGTGYEIGKTNKKDGKSNSPFDDNLTDPELALKKADQSRCSAQFDAWAKTHPEAPLNADQRALWLEYDAFFREWRSFYLDLNAMGTFDSADDAIRSIQAKYDQYLTFVEKYKKLGFTPSYVPPRPADPPGLIPQDVKNVFDFSSLWKVGAVALGGFLVYKWLTREKPIVIEPLVPKVQHNALPSDLP